MLDFYAQQVSSIVPSYRELFFLGTAGFQKLIYYIGKLGNETEHSRY